MMRGMAVAAPRRALGVNRQNVVVKRLADRARLLGAVEHGDRLDRARQRREEALGRKRPEQPNLQQADLFAARLQGVDRLLRRADARAHQDHDPLGIRAP